MVWRSLSSARLSRRTTTSGYTFQKACRTSQRPPPPRPRRRHYRTPVHGPAARPLAPRPRHPGPFATAATAHDGNMLPDCVGHGLTGSRAHGLTQTSCALPRVINLRLAVARSPALPAVVVIAPECPAGRSRARRKTARRQRDSPRCCRRVADAARASLRHRAAALRTQDAGVRAARCEVSLDAGNGKGPSELPGLSNASKCLQPYRQAAFLPVRCAAASASCALPKAYPNVAPAIAALEYGLSSGSLWGEVRTHSLSGNMRRSLSAIIKMRAKRYQRRACSFPRPGCQ